MAGRFTLKDSMRLRSWETIPDSKEIIHENPWYSVYKERFTLPSGKEGVYHVVDSPSSLKIIPVLPNGKIRFVKQFRYILKEESIEFPGGSVKHGDLLDEPEVGARRELSEEAHLTGSLKFLGNFYPINGIGSEKCFVFLATNCEESISEADETEEFIFVDLTLEDVRKMIKSGDISDGISLAAWMLFEASLL